MIDPQPTEMAFTVKEMDDLACKVDLAREGKSIMPRLFDNMLRHRIVLEFLFRKIGESDPMAASLIVDALGYAPDIEPDFTISTENEEYK